MIKALTNYFKKKTGITENSQRINNLEQKLSAQHNFLLSLWQLTATEKWAINFKLAQSVQQKLQNTYPSLGDFSTAVHKNDIMLAFHLYKTAPNVFWGLESYFNVGIRAVKELSLIAQEQSWDLHKILDFGSGYGRMSRFLPHFFEAEIIPTEVKEEAIKFQKEEFGFHGFAHSTAVEDFPSPEVDLIIALSVFSHLPKDATFAWLHKLMHCLKPKGALVFTYHPLEEQQVLAATNKDYLFLANSEDSLLPITEDFLENSEEYGVIFFKQEFLEGFFRSENWQFIDLGHRLTKDQKAFALWKD